MSKYLPTNCPNCGAILKNGKCDYCGTKVFLANAIDVPEHEMMDIVLQFRKRNETYILPLRGMIDSISFESNAVDVSVLGDPFARKIIATPPSVSFEFSGFIKEKE